MNRITNLFETKKNGILSVYFTAGYPQLNDTVTVLKELEARGINMVEIGIPFSDPIADGPVIQEAATQALRNGMSLHLLFEQLKDIRKEVQMPLILMGYLNPIMQFGFEDFCKKCVEVGIDGMIIPDLPFADYMSDYKEIADRYDLKMIMLITPETSEDRIRLIDEHTSGFIYMVSRSETGLFPPYQRNEPAKSSSGRFRNLQQSHLRCRLLQFLRRHHRQQIYPIAEKRNNNPRSCRCITGKFEKIGRQPA